MVPKRKYLGNSLLCINPNMWRGRFLYIVIPVEGIQYNTYCILESNTPAKKVTHTCTPSHVANEKR